MSTGGTSERAPRSLAEAEDHSWVDHAVRFGMIAYGAVYLLVGWLALQLALGQGTGSTNTDGAMTELAQQPFGQVALWLVVVGMLLLVALGVLAYAGVQAKQAVTEDFRKHLSAEGKQGRAGRFYVLAGKLGYAAKAVAVAIIGGLFAYAAISHDASKSGGMDQALQQVLEQPYGRYLLGLVAVGIAGYGVFCLARARHLSR